MGPRLLTALKAEVKGQCWRAQYAWIRLEQLLDCTEIQYDPEKPRGREDALVSYWTDVWIQIHAVFSAAGIVSRMLWPKPPRSSPPVTDHDREVAHRALKAGLRAQAIWRSWPLPKKRELRPLCSQSVRNAIEHVENDAAEWMETHGSYPVRASGMGPISGRGVQPGARDAFRYLFRDTRRVKVGKETCDLAAVIACLDKIDKSLPTSIRVDSGLPLVPVVRLRAGTYRKVGQRPGPR